MSETVVSGANAVDFEDATPKAPMLQISVPPGYTLETTRRKTNRSKVIRLEVPLDMRIVQDWEQ